MRGHLIEDHHKCKGTGNDGSTDDEQVEDGGCDARPPVMQLHMDHAGQDVCQQGARQGTCTQIYTKNNK